MSARHAHAYGPSALGDDARRFWELTLTLARSDFKLRYFGSALGYVWSLMRPLLFFGVLYVFFTEILQISKGVPHYGVYLLTCVVLWSYFAEVTGGSVPSLVNREGLLRKIRFPRMVIPLSVSLTAAFNLALNMVVVVVFALLNGVDPKLRWLELVPIVLGFAVMATGFGMLLSAAYPRFRDVAPIWEVLLQAWFYCSPIMYASTKYSSPTAIATFGTGLAHIAMINPAAMLFTQATHAVIGGPQLPSAPAVGGWLATVLAFTVILAAFAVGWWFFTREAPRVAENL